MIKKIYSNFDGLLSFWKQQLLVILKSFCGNFFINPSWFLAAFKNLRDCYVFQVYQGTFTPSALKLTTKQSNWQNTFEQTYDDIKSSRY